MLRSAQRGPILRRDSAPRKWGDGRWMPVVICRVPETKPPLAQLAAAGLIVVAYSNVSCNIAGHHIPRGPLSP
jgi:hypothetical protein